jgi:hypothetical protein
METFLFLSYIVVVILMARSCTCKICKKKGNTDAFYRVVDENGKNKYYCNKFEYESFMIGKEKKDSLIKYIATEVFNYDDGQIVPPILLKKLHELNNFYDYDVIRETFQVSKDNIQYWISVKNFSSEYGMISYLMKIVEGNINDVYKKWKFQQQQLLKQENNSVDLQMVNQLDHVIANKKNDEGILSFLDEEDI